MQPFIPALATALTFCAISPAACADTLYGLHAEAAVFYQTGDITLSDPGSTQNYDSDAKATPQLALKLEHPVPVIPNLLVRFSTIESNADNPNSDFTFGGATFSGSTQLDVDLTQTDLIAYYEVLDNWVSLDLGVGAKRLSGDATVSGETLLTTTSTKESVDETLPLLYGAVRIDLPLSGLSAGVQGSGFKYDQDHIIDSSARLSYQLVDELLVDAEVFGGYRLVDFSINDVGSQQAEGNLNGPFAGFNVHF